MLQFIPQLVDSALVLCKLPLHIIESSLRIIELGLPLLCAPVILSEGVCGVFQRLLQGADFLALGINFLIEDAVPGGKGLHGFILLIKLRGHEVHFRAKHLKGLVDFRQGLLKFLFAFDTDFQAKIVRHGYHLLPPAKAALNSSRDNIINEQFPLGLADPDKLLVALPQIQQIPERHQPRFLLGAPQGNRCIINQSGKQLLVAYPTGTFFGSASLSTFRFVPRNMASMIASL